MKPTLTDRIFKYVPWISLGILLFYLLAYVLWNPYLGFYFQNRSFEVTTLYSEQAGIQAGDVILRINDQTLEDFHDTPYTLLLPDVQVGDQLDLLIQRDGQQMEVDWRYPGITQAEATARVVNLHLLSLLLWAVGFLTYLLIRPRDDLWKLLIAFNFITALWIVTGGTAKYHYFLTPLMFRASLWLSLPVYLHLHWNLPKPLKNLPGIFWPVVYSSSGLVALCQFFISFPEALHFSVFLIAVVASILIVGARWLLRPEQRPTIGILVWASALSLLPVLAAILNSFANAGSGILAGALFALPLLPLAYFYAIFRYRLGGLSVRANQIVSIYLFLFLTITFTTLMAPLLINWLDFPGGAALALIGVAGIVVLVTATGFRRFQRFIESRVLGMPLPPNELLETHAEAITSSPTMGALKRTLSGKILPSMLIRESRLLHHTNQAGWQTILELETEMYPPLHENDLLALLDQSESYRSPNADEDHHWVRLVLPLHFDDQLMGMWLFGRRDPEDLYSPRDIAFLKTLANQTAIALTNVNLSADLRALYMANVSRQEHEKDRIARDLHDDILNEIAVLSMKLDGHVSEEFQKDYQKLTEQIRNTVYELRPPLLNHGLHAALEELAETLNARNGGKPQVDVSIPPSFERFDEQVEGHVFRIVQQACENALRHADADLIILTGSLREQGIKVEISDNGRGFDLGNELDLPALLANKHYGLANMVERAALIKANLAIESASDSGTTISLRWSAT